MLCNLLSVHTRSTRILLSAAILIMASCSGKSSRWPKGVTVAQHTLPSLPGNVVSLLISSDERRAAVQVNTKGAHTITYVIDLSKGQLQEVMNGEYLRFLGIPGKDEFVLVQQHQNKARFWLYDSSGKLLKSLSSQYPTRDPQVPYCQSADGIVICAAELPNMTEESPDYDPLGFSAVQVADLVGGRITLIKHPGTKHFGYDLQKKQLLISEALNENDGPHEVMVYSPTGEPLPRRKELHGTLFSPMGSYYLPQTHEYALPWEVYDTKTNAPILQFNINSEERRQGSYASPDDWNREQEKLLVVFRVHDTGQKSESGLELYDLNKKSLVYRLPGAGYMGWTQSGRKLIFLEGSQISLVQP